MKTSIYVISSLVFFNMIAFADQFDAKFSGGVNTSVSDVATGGLWEQNQSYGNWRLIVRNLGWDHTRSLLYLQWLKTDDKKKKILEYKTIPIPEFNTANWYNVSKIVYKNSSFVISYTIRGEEVARTATLLPGSPEKYKIIIDE